MKFRSVNRMVWFLLVQFFIIGGVMAQSSQCDANRDYLSQAQTAFLQAEYTSAVQAYSCALERDPANSMLRIQRIDSAILAGDYMTAYGDVFLLNNIAPETILTQLDRLRGQDDRYPLRAFLAIFAPVPDDELALSDSERILVTDPVSPFAHVIRAAAYEGSGDPESAQMAFQQALELSPDNAQIYGLMAAAQFTTFNVPGIRENATRALELDPTIAQLYRLRGFTSMLIGEPQAAIEDATRALERDPDYFAYYVLRGHAYLAIGDPEVALMDFDHVIRLVPEASFGYALRSEVRMVMGDQSAAAADLATAIELDTLELVEGDPLVAGETATATMTYGRVFSFPFSAQAGDTYTLSASSTVPGQVDPVLLIVAPDGTPLTFNDDADPDNDVLDSVIADFEPSTSATYTLVVSHALGGSEGDIQVLVEQN